MYLYKPKKRLSVVIPTSNDDDRLSLALEGYARQTFKDFEIHIVNDGGAASTGYLVESFRNRLDIYYHYFSAPGRYHPASARNVGINNSPAGRIVLSDCDVIPGPLVMEEHNKYGDDKIYVLGIRRRIPRTVTEHIMIPRYRAGCLDFSLIHKYPWVGDQRLNEDRFMGVFKHIMEGGRPPEHALDQYARHYGVTTAHMPGELWKAWMCWSFNVSYCGGYTFDPGFDCNYGYEDIELAVRLIADGYQVVVNTNIIAYHLDHDLRAPDSSKQNVVFMNSLKKVLKAMK